MNVYDNLYIVSSLPVAVNGMHCLKHDNHDMLNNSSGHLAASDNQRVYCFQALHESEPDVKTFHSVPGDRFRILTHLFRKCFS